jgi:hypothetical protein
MRQVFNQSGWNSSIERMGFREYFIQQRARPEHTTVWKCTSAQENAARSNETVLTNRDRFRCLPRLIEVDAVRKDLTPVSGKSREFPEAYSVRTIDYMPFGNCCMASKDQFWMTITIGAEIA